MNPGAAPAAERPPSATGLPWTVLVANKDVQAEMNAFAWRRNLLLGVFALLAIVIAAGSYSVARAIAHEFAVMRLQSDFVSAVSHEFRTPLTSLRQLSETLNSDRPLEEDRRRKYFQALERATRRLQKLVEGLLDFGRMESGAMVYRKREIDAGDLVASLADEFQRESADSGCQIELKATDDIPSIYADPEALGNAVWNLLDNAVKYSPDGKRIVFSGYKEGLAGVHLWTMPVTGGEPVQLAMKPGSDSRCPQWSPDGRWIAFNASAGGEPELWLMEDFLSLVKK